MAIVKKTPNGDFVTERRSLVHFLSVFSGQVTTILLVNCVRNMKWALSLLHTIELEGTTAEIALQQSFPFPQPDRFNSWTIIMLYSCNLISQCNICLTVRSDIPKTEICFRAKCNVECFIDVLAAEMFWGIQLKINLCFMVGKLKIFLPKVKKIDIIKY